MKEYEENLMKLLRKNMCPLLLSNRYGKRENRKYLDVPNEKPQSFILVISILRLQQGDDV